MGVDSSEYLLYHIIVLVIYRIVLYKFLRITKGKIIR